MKEIIDELDFNKIFKNIFALQKAISREWEKKKKKKKTPQAGRQYIWKKNCYLKYTKNG